jgi:hypothetical protein
MYQKEKPQSVLIGTWKFYQKGALSQQLLESLSQMDGLSELIYKID